MTMSHDLLNSQADALFKMAEETGKRRPNWSEDEILLLCKFINEKKHIIRSKFGSNISTQSKKAAWESITTQLNASNPSVKREKNEIEKKWHNVYSKSKKELTEHSKNSLKTGMYLAKNIRVRLMFDV